MSTCSLSRPNCRFQNLRGGIFEREPKLTDAPRALGPAWRIAGEVGEVLLVFEAGHGVVGLRLQIGAGETALRRRSKNGKPRARDEIVHERGDEHGLAGAREAGHAEPNRRRDEVGGIIAEIAEDVARGLRVGRDRHAGFLEQFSAKE